MSKLVLGGDKSYKMKWMNCWTMTGGQVILETGDQRRFFLKPGWQEANLKIKEKDSIPGTERVSSQTLRETEMLQGTWGTKHWAITCAALVKQLGWYSKDNKKPVRSFQQRSDIKWWLFYKSHLGSSVKKNLEWRNLGWRNQEGSKNTC